MFSYDEQQAIVLKALQQAMQAAQLAKMAPEPLLPVVDPLWPFALTEADRTFLRVNKISAA